MLFQRAASSSFLGKKEKEGKKEPIIRPLDKTPTIDFVKAAGFRRTRGFRKMVSSMGVLKAAWVLLKFPIPAAGELGVKY